MEKCLPSSAQNHPSETRYLILKQLLASLRRGPRGRHKRGAERAAGKLEKETGVVLPSLLPAADDLPAPTRRARRLFPTSVPENSGVPAAGGEALSRAAEALPPPPPELRAEPGPRRPLPSRT